MHTLPAMKSLSLFVGMVDVRTEGREEGCSSSRVLCCCVYVFNVYVYWKEGEERSSTV
jgi:hypothetical protein